MKQVLWCDALQSYCMQERGGVRWNGLENAVNLLLMPYWTRRVLVHHHSRVLVYTLVLLCVLSCTCSSPLSPTHHSCSLNSIQCMRPRQFCHCSLLCLRSSPWAIHLIKKIFMPKCFGLNHIPAFNFFSFACRRRSLTA